MANTPRYLRGPYCSTTPLLSPLLRLSVCGSPRAVVSSRPEYAHSLIFPHLPSRSLARSLAPLAFMTGTHLLAVRRLHKGTNVAFLPGLSGGSNARGDRGLATGIRIFDPFFLSLYIFLSVFLSLPLPLCEHRSKRKARKTRLFTLEKNLTTTFTKRLRIYAGLKDETRFNPPALFPSRYSDG